MAKVLVLVNGKAEAIDAPSADEALEAFNELPYYKERCKEAEKRLKELEDLIARIRSNNHVVNNDDHSAVTVYQAICDFLRYGDKEIANHVTYKTKWGIEFPALDDDGF